LHFYFIGYKNNLLNNLRCWLIDSYQRPDFATLWQRINTEPIQVQENDNSGFGGAALVFGGLAAAGLVVLGGLAAAASNN